MAELVLLDPLAPRTKTNRRTCVVMQDDVVRWVQPKHNVKILTSNKNLDDPVISKRTLTWERRTLSAREYVALNTRTRRSTSPAAPIVMTRTTRTSDDDKLERRGHWWSSRARKRTNYKGDCQYESESFTRLKSN